MLLKKLVTTLASEEQRLLMELGAVRRAMEAISSVSSPKARPRSHARRSYTLSEETRDRMSAAQTERFARLRGSSLEDRQKLVNLRQEARARLAKARAEVSVPPPVAPTPSVL